MGVTKDDSHRNRPNHVLLISHVKIPRLGQLTQQECPSQILPRVVVWGVEPRFEERDEEERVIDDGDVDDARDEPGVASPGNSLPAFAIDEENFGRRAPG
ncbi:hypothetical protein EYC84_003179 [Monilinia fructicola]|uniref:Uncharacterized protein n=1 Tax=Monilinia fructicola TaxID=38448 RepID=A0A5M9JV70_MONFR|nr:hypothetical protein EYC84_003179 [Monilinia fructicola]